MRFFIRSEYHHNRWANILVYGDVCDASIVEEPPYRSKSLSRATDANKRYVSSGSSTRCLIGEVENE